MTCQDVGRPEKTTQEYGHYQPVTLLVREVLHSPFPNNSLTHTPDPTPIPPFPNLTQLKIPHATRGTDVGGNDLFLCRQTNCICLTHGHPASKKSCRKRYSLAKWLSICLSPVFLAGSHQTSALFFPWARTNVPLLAQLQRCPLLLTSIVAFVFYRASQKAQGPRTK